MSSGLEVRLCTLKQIVSGGQPQSFGQIVGHASSDAIAATIVALEFEGAFVKTDLTDLRDKVRVALGAGFPGNDVLIIAAAKNLTGDEIDLAGDRALAIKDFLLALGVPAAHVAADSPSPYLKPTNAG